MTAPFDEALVEAVALALFAHEQCDRRQREDVRGNWDSRLNDADQQEYRDLATAALAAVEAALPVEFGIMRPASVPDMSGKPAYTQIVSATFRTREEAERARRAVPSLRGVPALICERVAPGPWREVSS